MKRAIVYAIVLAMVVVACSSGDGASTTTALSSTTTGGASDTTAPPESTTVPSEDEEPVSFTVALAGPLAISDVPALAALDRMRADGHDVELVEVAEPELAIEGLATGSFQFSGTSGNAALVAIQQGAPIKYIADQVGYGHAVLGVAELTECSDLDGRLFGHFSEGSVGTAVFNYWLDRTCPGTEPNMIVIGGASVRYLALTSGEIDATLLPLVEVIQLEQEAPGEYATIANLGQEIGDVRAAPFYGNTQYMEENPRAVELFLGALLEVYEEINADYTVLVEMTSEFYPEALPAGIEDLVAETYIEVGMFDLLALNPETTLATIEFFEFAGEIEPGLTVEDVADFSYLDAAVAEAGG